MIIIDLLMERIGDDIHYTPILNSILINGKRYYNYSIFENNDYYSVDSIIDNPINYKEYEKLLKNIFDEYNLDSQKNKLDILSIIKNALEENKNNIFITSDIKKQIEEKQKDNFFENYKKIILQLCLDISITDDLLKIEFSCGKYKIFNRNVLYDNNKFYKKILYNNFLNLISDRLKNFSFLLLSFDSL